MNDNILLLFGLNFQVSSSGSLIKSLNSQMPTIKNVIYYKPIWIGNCREIGEVVILLTALHMVGQ